MIMPQSQKASNNVKNTLSIFWETWTKKQNKTTSYYRRYLELTRSLVTRADCPAHSWSVVMWHHHTGSSSAVSRDHQCQTIQRRVKICEGDVRWNLRAQITNWYTSNKTKCSKYQNDIPTKCTVTRLSDLRRGRR